MNANERRLIQRWIVSLGRAFACWGVGRLSPVYDLVLKHGHVIDPKNGVDRVADVAISGGKIARVGSDIGANEAKKTVDVTGLLVTPGLVDIHVHVYLWQEAGGEAAQADSHSFRNGVTTMVDAGSSGARTFPDFRDRIIAHAKTRILAFLNIVGAGMGTGKEDDPAEMDAEAAAQVAKANPDVIVGFKTAHYAGPGWESVEGAVKAGELSGLPVMVDFGRINGVRNINALFLDKLRPGDIFTHCFSGHREELLANGKMNPAMEAGRKTGGSCSISGTAQGQLLLVCGGAGVRGTFLPGFDFDRSAREQHECGDEGHDQYHVEAAEPGIVDGGCGADVDVEPGEGDPEAATGESGCRVGGGCGGAAGGSR